MTILYIGYWGANEGLSQATINPHLKILDELGVDRILYTSIERQNSSSFQVPVSPHIIHLPIFPSKSSFHFLSKWLELVTVYRQLVDIIHKDTPHLIICRSALAGIYGYWLHRKFRIPFYVESFEPHGEYMVESGIWSRYGASYLFYTKFEKLIKNVASGLMPVSNNYLKKLLEEGLDKEKIHLMPCAVNIQRFAFDPIKRKKIRDILSINKNAIVGIYVGKFGGIYLEKEAFDLFHKGFLEFEKFYLIILSPHPKEEILLNINKSYHDSVYVANVGHEKVPDFLSAADFAFSLHKPEKSKKYLSPIKNGEYWANGLPILIPDGIGDDSEIIQKEKAGFIIELNKDPYKGLSSLMDDYIRKYTIPKLAFKYRDFATTKLVYQKIIAKAREMLHLSD